MTEEEQREAVVAEAESWVGTPYHHIARIKGVGVDCATLSGEVYARAGIVPPQEIPFYPAQWFLHRSAELYMEHVQRYATEFNGPMKPGDLVLFKIGRCFAHGAIVTRSGWPNIIHADIECGLVLVARADGGRLAERQKKFFTCWPETK